MWSICKRELYRKKTKVVPRGYSTKTYENPLRILWLLRPTLPVDLGFEGAEPLADFGILGLQDTRKCILRH